MTNLTAEQNNGWIKCKDRLPPYRKEVLVYSGSVYMGYRHHTDEAGDWWTLNCRADKQWNDVTHWRPLPEKPNEF